MPRRPTFRRKYFLMCADDFATLVTAMRTYRTHPLIYGIDRFFDASICRLLIVNRVDFVENLLKYWQAIDKHSILEAYFLRDESDPKPPLRKRVESLRNAFEIAGFKIDDAIFNKFLALKLLRNKVVHGDLDTKEKRFIEQQGFPSNLEELRLEHGNEVIRISSALIGYIFETTPFKKEVSRDDSLSKLNKLVHLHEELGFNPQSLDRKLDDDICLVKKSDVARMFWNNLEKISERLTYSNLDAEVIGLLTRAAEESWQEFWRLTFSSNFVDVPDLEKAVKFYARYHRDDYVGLTEEESNSSLIIGQYAQESVPNVTAVSLLLKQLPAIDPERTKRYIELGRQAFATWEAAYYARNHPATDASLFDHDHLEEYRRILNAE